MMPPTVSRLPRVRGFPGKLLALFLCIAGAKLCLLRAAGSPLPFFDAWAGEGDTLLRPWLEGTWQWTTDLFAPFYQHRIALTRLVTLGIFEGNNQQWDNRAAAVVAICLHGGFALVLATILTRRLGREHGNTVLVAVALLAAPPFGWENTLTGGFQSQFYFLLLFSVLAIWGLASQPPRSPGWWIGVGAAVLAWFSIASGPLAALAVALWAAVRWALRDGSRREALVSCVTGVILFLGGASLSVGVPQVAKYSPASLGEFFGEWLGFLSWPYASPALSLLVWSPFAVLAWQRGRARSLGGRAERFLFPCGLWLLLQAGAMAASRHGAGGSAVSRYQDLLSPALVISLGCLLVLTHGGAILTWPARAAAMLWVGVQIFGLGERTAHALRDELPFVCYNNARARENIAAFVASGDPQIFANRRPYDFQSQDLPRTAELLSNDAIRRCLPACVRAPLALEPDSALRFVSGTRALAGNAAVSEPVWLSQVNAAAPEASFRSRPIRDCRPYLEFTVFGPVGLPGCRLALVSESDPAHPAVLTPRDQPGGGWRRVVVKTPRAPFRIEATVSDGGANNLAFLLPREVGVLSAATEHLLDLSVELFSAGLALGLAIVWGERWRRRSGTARRPAWPALRGKRSKTSANAPLADALT